MTVTPHQTILLKLLDAHLQLPSNRSKDDNLALLRFLAELHLQLADVATRSFHAYITAAAENKENTALDDRLPSVVEAIVLVTQALCALLLVGASKPEDEDILHTAKSVRLQDGTDSLYISDLSIGSCHELSLHMSSADN